MEPLKLKAAFQDYIWGGTRLRDEFGKDCDFERVAESWELSCHPAGLAVIVNSVYKGLTLKEYLEQDWAARVGSLGSRRRRARSSCRAARAAAIRRPIGQHLRSAVPQSCSWAADATSCTRPRTAGCSRT